MKNFLKKSHEAVKREGAMGVGGRTKEKIAKRNPMTALRFQTEGRHLTNLASLQGPYNTKKGRKQTNKQKNKILAKTRTD